MAGDSNTSRAILLSTLGDQPYNKESVYAQHSSDPNAVVTLRAADGESSGLLAGGHSTIQDDQIICLTPPEKDHDTSNGSGQWRLFYAAVDVENDQPADSKEKPSTYLRILYLETAPPEAIINKYLVANDAAIWTNSTIKIIVSVLSGSQHARVIYENIIAPFLSFVMPSDTSKPQAEPKDVLFTTSANSVREYTTDTIMPTAEAGNPQLIILLAGDGGIVDVVNTAFAHPTSFTPPTIALIPCGTGNALANSTSVIPLAPLTLGLRTLALGTPHPLPLLTARFSPPAPPYHAPDAPGPAPAPTAAAHAAVVVSWGLHAALVADSDTPAYRAHGAARFGLAARENLFPADGSAPHAYRGQLALQLAGDDDTWHAVQRDEHAYVLATLVAQLERGFTISPRARPLDGVLRVVHFGPLPGGGQEVMQVMGAAYDGGKHVAHVPGEHAGNVAGGGGAEVAYGAVRAMRIAFGEEDARWRRVCVDGKIFTVGRGGEVLVEVCEERVVDLLHCG